MLVKFLYTKYATPYCFATSSAFVGTRTHSVFLDHTVNAQSSNSREVEGQATDSILRNFRTCLGVTRQFFRHCTKVVASNVLEVG